MALITLDAWQPFPTASSGYNESNTELRVWYGQDFIDSDGVSVQGGNGRTGFYIVSVCTFASHVMTIPAFDLRTTVDAQDPNPQSIQCFAQLYSNGSAKQAIFTGNGTSTGWIIYNPDPATTTTFQDLTLLNQASYLANAPVTYSTTPQMVAYVNSLSPAANASAVVKGITKLSVAPASSVNPIAKGDNDSTLPTITTPIVYADQSAFSGNAGAKIAAAIASLVSSGGTVDARGLYGSQTISQDIFAGVTKPLTLLLGDGTYTCTVQSAYVTSANTTGIQIIGSGEYSTLIDNQVPNGAAFSLDGSNAGAASNVFQRGAILRDFSIITGSSQVASQGIILRANHAPIITQIRIEGLSSHAIQIVNENGDADAVAYLTMANCRLDSNGGWGFYMADDPSGLNASGSFEFINNEIASNASGGMRAVGLDWRINGGTIAQNTGYGVYVPRLHQTFNTLEINGTEFDGNSIAHINIEAGAGISLNQLRLLTTSHSGFVPSVGVKVGKTGEPANVNAMVANGTLVRADGGTLTVFQIANNALNTEINNLIITGAGSVTNYTDAGTGTRVRQDNQDSGAAVSTTNQPGLSGTYIPNGKIVFHRLTLSAATLTIANPTGAEDGREIELDITNVSGGATTITFGGAFLTNGWAAINAALTNGLRTSATFRYQATSASWRQVGAWSPPA